MCKDKLYDDTKIGAKVGCGGDKIVYMYGSDKVIKFSRFARVGGIQVKNKLKNDYNVCKKYFKDYIVEVNDVSPNLARTYIETQDYIVGEPMSLKHASNDDLMHQLREILNTQKDMIEDGYSMLDLIGNGGIFKPSLSNIFVDHSNQLRIIDVLLMEIHTLPSWWAVVLAPLKRFAIWRQKKTIKMMYEYANINKIG